MKKQDEFNQKPKNFLTPRSSINFIDSAIRKIDSIPLIVGDLAASGTGNSSNLKQTLVAESKVFATPLCAALFYAYPLRLALKKAAASLLLLRSPAATLYFC
ncbi:MAG: hypothetical protein GKR88_18510 [Flavobacteriaceae bacterium]|nr:MAG: hypothetical protein GKR88_18510 [Flavobacteriaceae bacterium]